MRIEFLLEEQSMKFFLIDFLPRILPQNMKFEEDYFIRVFNGKQDLKRNLPFKIKAYSNFQEKVKVFILHDQDSSDCRLLKNELLEICKKNGNCELMIRIVCKELESWYLGDLESIEKIYPKFNSIKYKNKSKFRNPDNLIPSNELNNLNIGFQKLYASRQMGKIISIDENRSISFKQFLRGIEKFITFNNKISE